MKIAGDVVGSGYVGESKTDSKIANSYAMVLVEVRSATLVGRVIEYPKNERFSQFRGLIGRAENTSVKNGYWDQDSSNQCYSRGGSQAKRRDTESRDF